MVILTILIHLIHEHSISFNYLCPRQFLSSKLGLWPVLIRALISFMSAPPSWPKYHPKAPSQNIITLGLDFNIWMGAHNKTVIIHVSRMTVPLGCLGQTLFTSIVLLYLLVAPPFTLNSVPILKTDYSHPIYYLIPARIDLREQTGHFGVHEQAAGHLSCFPVDHLSYPLQSSLGKWQLLVFRLSLSLRVTYCLSMNSHVVFPCTPVPNHLSSPFFILLAVCLWLCQNLLFRPQSPWTIDHSWPNQRC